MSERNGLGKRWLALGDGGSVVGARARDLLDWGLACSSKVVSWQDANLDRVGTGDRLQSL